MAQVITIVSIQTGVKGRKLSDLEFLSIKEFNGKRVDVNALLSLNDTVTETDLVTQTANAGKDMYLGEASIGGQATNVPALDNVVYKLFVNAIEIDRYRKEQPTEFESWTYTFTTKGIKVTTGQIIKITAKNSAAGANVNSRQQGKLILWEENTGISPQIQSI